jgi:hypothetical protein
LETEFAFLRSMGPNVKESKVMLTTMEEFQDENNPFDIDFHPANEQEARDFKQLLMQELNLCQIPIQGTVRENRNLLRSALEAQEKYKLILKLLASRDLEAAFVTIEAAIPCILHGGNRLGEKNFMMLMLAVWRICGTKQQKQDLVDTVEYFVNTAAFGTEQSCSQWKLPLDKEQNLDTVTFSAWRVRKILLLLSDLAERLFRDMSNAACLPQWQNMLRIYMEVLTIAFQHEDFSDKDIEEFQDVIDIWYSKYVELLGMEGVSNYAHLLGAGHLYHYLKKWGNLYRFQQQGWGKKMAY